MREELIDLYELEKLSRVELQQGIQFIVQVSLI